MIDQGADSIRIANEYATVVVRPVTVDGEERLRIESPKLDHSVTLRGDDLQALIEQDKDFFSRLLEHPYGPDE